MDHIRKLLEQEKFEEVEEYMSQLPPKEYADAFLALLDYIVPKLQRTEPKGDDSHQVVVVMSPVPDDIDNTN